MGIPLGSQFTMNAAFAIDDRTVFANTAARDALSALRRYEGLIVYVVADQAFYALVGGTANGNWVEFGGSSGGSSMVPLSITYESGPFTVAADEFAWVIPLHYDCELDGVELFVDEDVSFTDVTDATSAPWRMPLVDLSRMISGELAYATASWTRTAGGNTPALQYYRGDGAPNYVRTRGVNAPHCHSYTTIGANYKIYHLDGTPSGGGAGPGSGVISLDIMKAKWLQMTAATQELGTGVGNTTPANSTSLPQHWLQIYAVNNAPQATTIDVTYKTWLTPPAESENKGFYVPTGTVLDGTLWRVTRYSAV